jgi:hypothetical protein
MASGAKLVEDVSLTADDSHSLSRLLADVRNLHTGAATSENDAEMSYERLRDAIALRDASPIPQMVSRGCDVPVRSSAGARSASDARSHVDQFVNDATKVRSNDA